MAEQLSAIQGLTPTQLKLLEVLINPENVYKNISEKCRIAECDRNTYYNAFKNPLFCQAVDDLSKQLVKSSVLPVINSFQKQAERGSCEHGKVLLKMAGMYKDNMDVTLTGNADNPVQSVQIIKFEGINRPDFKGLPGVPEGTDD